MYRKIVAYNSCARQAYARGIGEKNRDEKITDLRGMSRINGLRNDMNKRTFYKERKINKRRIHFSSKQNIKAPLILDMYVI